MTGPVAPSTDSGLSRLHSTPATDSDARELRLRRWENRLQRAITKLEYGDERRAIRMLMDLKADMGDARAELGAE